MWGLGTRQRTVISSKALLEGWGQGLPGKGADRSWGLMEAKVPKDIRLRRAKVRISKVTEPVKLLCRVEHGLGRGWVKSGARHAITMGVISLCRKLRVVIRHVSSDLRH